MQQVNVISFWCGTTPIQWILAFNHIFTFRPISSLLCFYLNGHIAQMSIWKDRAYLARPVCFPLPQWNILSISQSFST